MDSNASIGSHNPDDARSRRKPLVREGVSEALTSPEKHKSNPTKAQDNLEPKKLRKYNLKYKTNPAEHRGIL
jgi:hypothetical protein